MNWPFRDPANVAVFSSTDIVEKHKWIYYVSHDDDCAWQFHSIDGPPSSETDARVVSLGSIVELDPSVADLADLPLGWCAWRETLSDVWQRQPKKPE
jgi:hypothetical protein